MIELKAATTCLQKHFMLSFILKSSFAMLSFCRGKQTLMVSVIFQTPIVQLAGVFKTRQTELCDSG